MSISGTKQYASEIFMFQFHIHTHRSLSFLQTLQNIWRHSLLIHINIVWTTNPLQPLCFMVLSATDSINSLSKLWVPPASTSLVRQLDAANKTEVHKQRMLELGLLISIDVTLLGYFAKLGHLNILYFTLPFILSSATTYMSLMAGSQFSENLAFCLRTACNYVTLYLLPCET